MPAGFGNDREPAYGAGDRTVVPVSEMAPLSKDPIQPTHLGLAPAQIRYPDPCLRMAGSIRRWSENHCGRPRGTGPPARSAVAECGIWDSSGKYRRTSPAEGA